MKEKKIKLRDPVVERVVDKFITRSDIGYEKYKITLDSERIEGKKDLPAYLNDVQEELMDAILYIQTAREELVGKTYCKCEVKDVNDTYSKYWKYVTDATA
tara:strand:+ start:120 stop:422 length:303 start_codon:yes stop_codon:yes gene_type:complete